MSEIRIGVIGAGGMGSEHARNLAAIDGVRVALVADAVRTSAEALAAVVGAEPTTDAAGLITASDVDAVVIASPDGTHADLAIAALDAGRPMLCEKPLAPTLAEATRVMVAEAATGARLIQLGFMRVFDPVHVVLRAEVEANGPVQHIRAVHRNRNEFVRTMDHAISQSLVHDVHTVRWLSGSEISQVQARVVPRGVDGVRFVTVSLALASGALATIEFDDLAFGYDVSVEVTGEHGLARTPPPADPSLHDDWFAWFSDAYRLEVEAWVASVRAGIPVGPSARDGVAAQAVVRAIQRSARSGGEETVDNPT